MIYRMKKTAKQIVANTSKGEFPKHIALSSEILLFIAILALRLSRNRTCMDSKGQEGTPVRATLAPPVSGLLDLVGHS